VAKFGRTYRLTSESNVDSEAIVIEPPISIQFNLNRSTMASLNNCQIRILNLSQLTRSKIFQDRFNLSKRKKVILQAGYEKLSTIFVGDIFMADSYRQGNDIITFIDARDGGFDSSGTLTNKTIQKGTTVKSAIEEMIKQFSNIKQGKIGTVEGEFKRPVVLDGNTFELIKKYTDDKAFIDLEKVNILQDNETITGEIALINSETGLLGVPRRNDSFLTIDTLFEPRITMGQVLAIESTIQPEYDGQYKVIGVNHAGTISESIGGSVKSRFSLLIGTQLTGGGFTNIG